MDPEEASVPPSKKQKCTPADDPSGSDSETCNLKGGTAPLQASDAQPDVSIGSHLSEKDVGITEYVGKHNGFFAVLKQRYHCVDTSVCVWFMFGMCMCVVHVCGGGHTYVQYV